MPEMAQRESFASAASPVTSVASGRRTSLLADEDADPHVPDSIPPWVHLTHDGAPPLPEPARPNTRHWKPSPPHSYKPGRKWDHLRSAEAVLISSPIAEQQEKWKPFMQSSPTTRYEADNEGARLVSDAWVEENMPISRRGWDESDEANVDKNEDDDGFWLLWFLSTDKRERVMRVFWVCYATDCTSIRLTMDIALTAQERIHSSNLSHCSARVHSSGTRYRGHYIPVHSSSQYGYRSQQQLFY